MSEEQEHLFQRSNSCWICKKLIDNEEIFPVIFHNLRGYDSHLIFNELDKFDVKISVRQNGLEKYMTFF